MAAVLHGLLNIFHNIYFHSMYLLLESDGILYCIYYYIYMYYSLGESVLLMFQFVQCVCANF